MQVEQVCNRKWQCAVIGMHDATGDNSAMSAVFEKPSLLQRVSPDAAGLRRAAGVRRVPAGLRGPAHHVLLGLRPRHPLRRPRPQHADRRPAHVRGGPGAAAAADEPGGAAVRAGRVAADRGGDVRHHQEGRQALDQRRRRDPAQRNPEDRHAADAGLVVPEARRPAAAAGFPDGGTVAGGAGGADREAARPGHRRAGAGCRAVGDFLRRADLEADRCRRCWWA